MKRMTMVLAISVAIFFAACGGPTREARLMSYNVRNCLGLDGEVESEAKRS